MVAVVPFHRKFTLPRIFFANDGDTGSSTNKRDSKKMVHPQTVEVVVGIHPQTMEMMVGIHPQAREAAAEEKAENAIL